MSPFCILHIGVYLLQSVESLRLFESRHLYEPCFYSDKYGTVGRLESIMPAILSIIGAGKHKA